MDSDSVRGTYAGLASFMDSDSVRGTYAGLASFMDSDSVRGTYAGLNTPSLIDDSIRSTQEAPRQSSEAPDLHSLQSESAGAHPALPCLLAAALPVLVYGASAAALPLLETMVLGLRLLGVLASLEPAVNGTLVLITVMGLILAVNQLADRP